MQREAVVFTLILLGHSRQSVDVEASFCEIFRQSASAIHTHDGVQCPLAPVRKNPLLLLQIPAALNWRGRSDGNHNADLRALQRALDQVLQRLHELTFRNPCIHIDLESTLRVALGGGHAAETSFEQLQPLRLVRDAHLGVDYKGEV